MPSKFLAQVLSQSEYVKELIGQSAEALAAVSTAIKHEIANREPLPGVEIALDQNEAVRRKLQDASGALTAMNEALANTARERTMIDHQLAAAVEQEQGARNAALHDRLTGLPNRALFNDRLEHGIAQARRHRWILAVMFLDLDKFKSINDRYGHQTGDAVLQSIAMRLKHNTRDEDTVSRYGGDEFLYLVAQIHDQKDIAKIAEKIHKAIQMPCKVSVDGATVELCLEASIGIAIFPNDGTTANALIESADQAMYGAKESKSGYAFAR